jgi:hypothetical protein
MTEPVMDFQTYVWPAYEVRPDPPRKPVPEEELFLLNARVIVPVGEGRLVRPTLKAVDFTIGLLLRTPLAKPHPKDGLPNPDADQIAVLERNAVAIARRVGLLSTLHRLARTTEPPFPADLNRRFVKDERDRLIKWHNLAETIQTTFGRPPSQLHEIPIGLLHVYMSFQSGGSRSMVLRPERTGEALIYRAAQLASSGAKLQRCEKCSGQFLIGGPRTRGKKKEGARFCSEQCRWDYNNARRKRN